VSEDKRYHEIAITMRLRSWATLDVALRTWLASEDYPPGPELRGDFENMANQITADLQHVVGDLKMQSLPEGAPPDNSDLL
jgi:hypothetical protein